MPFSWTILILETHLPLQRSSNQPLSLSKYSFSRSIALACRLDSHAFMLLAPLAHVRKKDQKRDIQ